MPDLPILNEQKDADGGYIAIPAVGGDQAPRDIADVDWIVPSMWAVPNIDEEDSIGGSIPQVTSAGGILTLISKADKAWVQVEVDGQKEYHVIKKDQQLTWQARRSITVTTGSANTMAANWNGQVINELSNSPAAKVTFPQGG